MSQEAKELDFDIDAAIDDMMGEIGIETEGAVVEELDGEVVGGEVELKEGPAGQAPIETAPAGEPAAPAAQPESEAPRTWSPEEAKHWAGMSPEARAAVLRREADMFKGIEQYKGEASVGRGVRKLLEPYREILERERIDPMSMLGNLVNAHAKLSLGHPHEKVQMMQSIMMDYGVTLEQLAGIAEVPKPLPEIQSLQSQVAQLNSQLRGFDEQRLASQRAEVEQQIRAFAADPAHPYFGELSDDITGLIRGGVCKNLQDAYDRAVWANPVTRAKEQARLQTVQAEEAKKVAAEKAKTARLATAANVRTTAKRGSAAAPLGSLEDTIEEVFADIKAGS